RAGPLRPAAGAAARRRPGRRPARPVPPGRRSGPGMTFGPRRFLAPLAVVAFLAAAPGTALAQQRLDGDPERIAEGTHVFRRILFEQNLKPVGSFEELQTLPANECIVVLLGDLQPVLKLQGLRHFLRGGGAVLLASDLAVTDPGAYFQIVDVTRY